MKAIQIKKHQIDALNAIVTAIEKKQKHITVEMVTGAGKSIVLAKTVEYLMNRINGKILIVTSSVHIKEQLNNLLFGDYNSLVNINKNTTDIKTAQYINTHSNEVEKSCEYIFAYDIPATNRCYEMLYKTGKTMIIFQEYTKQLFKTGDVVFTYSHQDAVKDGILAPVADPSMYEYAVGGFCKRLLEKFNCKLIEPSSSGNDDFWDFCFSNENQKIWVQYKTYKSEDISFNAINSVLKNIVRNKEKGDFSEDDIVLLILLGNAFGVDKKLLYSKFKIVIWDISNLVFYTANDKSLFNELSQLTYFPIDNIEGEEAEAWNFTTIESSDVIEEDLSLTTAEYINKLKSCKTGRNNSSEYEVICEEIVRYLFKETFYHMSSQHKTKDKHFRMDLICSFKGTNEKTHPFWQLLTQHYNTHFVVFEFKNYGNKIDQNLIYITEKYLFNPALRNVAIIISRKGFSEAATFAAGGCLKEHGKLILNITDDDLIKMLEDKENDGEPTTLLMEKFESFLMSISK